VKRESSIVNALLELCHPGHRITYTQGFLREAEAPDTSMLGSLLFRGIPDQQVLAQRRSGAGMTGAVVNDPGSPRVRGTRHFDVKKAFCSRGSRINRSLPPEGLRPG
jgi:hypothetical protein